MLKELKVSYRENPIGLDERPRFSWKLSGEGNDIMQAAYQIQVICSGKMSWDSGKVESEESVLIPYEGSALLPMTEYHVKVSVWDNHGMQQEAMGSFETGLLGQENWKGKWITHTLPEEEKACPIFVKKFVLPGKKVTRARIYATACGVYEISLNGEKVGDSYMAPGWTSYHNRLQYQTYDVTGQFSGAAEESHGAAEYELAAVVGNGWYKGYLSFTNEPNHYGDRTAFLMMLCVEYEDGTTSCIGTDTDWEVYTGCIKSSEIYYGETHDYTVCKGNAVTADRIGDAVLFENTDKIRAIVAQESEPVRITKRFPVKEKIVTPKGELVLDFGQNMAGIVEVKLPKLSGDRLVIRHAETLDKNGNFYTENLRAAVSTDTYVYGKDEVDRVITPHFTFHGFRYICLEGVSQDVDISRFTACALHTDMQETGSFACDNALVNQLQSNIAWGQRSNFLDVPTDCPQRDERLGWTGDAQVFCGTAGYNFDTALFFQKWMRDVAAETTTEWGVPHVVPNILGDQAGAAAWSDCATIIPWTMYQIYGDKEILREQYGCMKMWVDYITAHCGANGLWQSGFQYGDWLGLDIEQCSNERVGATDRYLVANAYYAYSTRILRDAAEVLGYEEDAREYGARYDNIVEKINEEYVTKTGRLVSETQTACVLMLHFHLVKPEYRERVLATLTANLGAHRNHLTTGFVGTPYLCHTLSENGAHEIAEAVFLKEDFPGWFYAVKKGATTIWERWNSILPNGDFDQSGMNSLNHYAYGSIGDWMYRKIAGINPLAPGYKEILIQPILTHGMTKVDAAFESVYGTIRSAWSCKDGKITIDVTIPPNTTAVLCLPEKADEIEVGSGTYHYEYETKTKLEVERFTMESTLGEVVAEKLAVDIINQFAPGMLDNPMIQYAYDMTMAELTAQAPDAKPLYEAVLAALNAQEK